MASLASHRVRAVLSAVLDGAVVGGAEAALDLPPRSWPRARVYLAITAAVAAETAARELPTLRRVLDGLPVVPEDPRQRSARLHQALVTVGWGLVVTVVDGPLAGALRRRGSARPHLLLGAAVGVATAASTLPVWWRRAGQQAADDAYTDEALASLDAELAELLDGGAPG